MIPTSSHMLFLQNQQIADDSVWNLSSYIFLQKKVAPDFLESCLNEIIKSSDALRLRPVFTANGTFLETFPYSYRTFEKHRFETEEAFLCWAKETVNRPVFHRPGMWEAYIIEVAGKSGILNVGHHAMSDGLNVAVLYEKLLQCVSGKTPEAQSYLPHLEAESQYRASKKYEKDKRFWESRLKDGFLSEFFLLPAGQTERGCTNRTYALENDCVRRMEAFCGEHGITESALIYGAAALTLFYLRRADRFSIGIPVLGRTTQADMHALGLFMHTVPMIVEIADTDLLTFLRQTEEQVFDLFRHQQFTIYDIKKEIRDLPVSGPLYDITVDYSAYEPDPAYESRVLYNDSVSGAMDLHFLKEGDRLTYTLRCRDSLRNDPIAARFHSTFLSVISAILETPEASIPRLSPMSPAEREFLLYGVNDTKTPEREHPDVCDLFLRHVNSDPDKPAVTAADGTLSYRELDILAGRLAKGLRNAGVGPGDIVAVCLPRDSRLICAILGVLKAGAAYLPLDPQQPPERLRFFINDSGAKHCISEESYGSLMAEEPILRRVPTEKNTLCYCVYTSGSTGTPKGVLIRRDNLAAYVYSLRGIYGDAPVNMPFFTSAGVDLSVTSVYLPLATGGCVYAYDGDLTGSLPQITRNPALNILKLTPTHMRIMCALSKETELKNIKHVIAGGEALYRRDAVEFTRCFGKHLIIHNEYGPTETTVGCMDHVFDPSDTSDVVPIGKPIANTQVYVVDKYMQPVPVGVTGELCIAGDGVGGGYLNRPALTAEKFIPNPFGDGPLYKTGDLAFVREDGVLVFAGRNDLQIKLNGHRVEPGEIEAALCRTDGVESAAVIVRQGNGNRQLLCAFYTGREIPAKELRTALIQILPTYMIPHAFVHLDAMPMTSSGKTDRGALPETGLFPETGPEAELPPATPEQLALAEAVARMLGLDHVSMADRYYALGGDSIRAIHIVSALIGKGYELAVPDLMQSAALSDAAEKMKPLASEDAPETDALSFPLTPAQEGIWLQTVRAPESPAYRLQFLLEITRPFAADILRKSFVLLALRHPALCCAFPDANAAGQLKQTVKPDRTIRMEETVYPFAKDEALLQERLVQAKAIPFDFETDVLLRAEYLVFTDARYLLICAHHIILDGWSLPVLARDLFRFADRLSAGEPFEKLARETEKDLPARSVFRRYALKLAHTDKTQAYAYWDRLLDGCRPARLFPEGFSAEGDGTDRAVYETEVPESILTAAARLTQAYGITENTLLEGAFALTLRRFSGGGDVVFCKAVSGRAVLLEAIEQGVGPFLNTVPVRASLRLPEMTATDFLRQTQEQAIRANRFGILRLGEVLRRGGIRREETETLFAFENYYFETKEGTALSALPFRLADAAEQTEFPLAVTLQKTEGRMRCRISYAPWRFSRNDIERLAEAYMQLLRQFTAENVLSLPVTDLCGGPLPPVSPAAADALRQDAPAYVPPETESEEVLARTAAHVLHLDRAGLKDSFFALGGDSIRAIHMANELQDAGWSLRIVDSLRADTLRFLAKKMTRLPAAEEFQVQPDKQYYSLPPAARAYLHAAPASPERLWQSCIIETDGTADAIKAALTELTRRHPILRAVRDGEVLRILPEGASAPRFRVFSAASGEDAADARRRLSALDIGFDTASGPLTDAALYLTPEGNLLRLTVHHLAIDLFSWEILLSDLQGILRLQTDPAAPALPEKTAGFGQWMDALNRYKTSMPAQDAVFWAQCRAETRRAHPLFTEADPPTPGEEIGIDIDADLAAALLAMELTENIRLEAPLLAALGRAAAAIAGGDVCVCVESLGRTQLSTPVRIERTVGWFTAIYPVVLGDEADATQLLFDLRRKLQRVPQDGVGWLLLNEKLPEKAGLMFNFYRYRSGDTLRAQPVFPTGEHAYDMLFPGVISVDCSLADGDLSVLFRSPALRRPPQLLRELADRFASALREITEIADFSGQRADAADAFTDDTLTYRELSALDAIFNGVDDDEQN